MEGDASRHDEFGELCRVVVVGKVYPAYSKSHDEVACTGGIRPDTGELLRLHPVPYRYLEGDQQFSNWQWIRVALRPHEKDTRPNTYRIEPSSIELQGKVPPGHLRREITESCAQHFDSVDALKAQQLADRSSLGVVRPREILAVLARSKTKEEEAHWVAREAAILQQQRLFGDPPKKLDFIDKEFVVEWKCFDPECRTHSMALHQWGIHELYRKLRGKHDSGERATTLTVEKLESELDLASRDLFFFLGNYHYRPHQFGLMDILPVRKTNNDGQTQLF